MSNEIIEKYSKLNDDGKFYVDCALNAAVSNPEYLNTITDEERQEIKRKREEREKEEREKETEDKEFYDNLKAESKDFTKQEYIDDLVSLLSVVSLGMVKYIYTFANLKVYYNIKDLREKQDNVKGGA